MSTPQTPLRIGVLYEDTQMTDLAGLDIFGFLTPEYLDAVVSMNPAFEPLRSSTVPMEFLYISSTLDPARCTPDMYVRPTHTYATAPRDLDVILMGGPDLNLVKEESLEFLRQASKKTKLIFSTCTGGMWLAKSGVLDGKKATTNRGMLHIAKQAFPQVEWVDQRWVVEDGSFEGAQFWTAGGAGCGKLFVDVQNFGRIMLTMVKALI